MLGKLLIAFGIFEVVRPRPVIDACEQIGLENPEAAERRPIALWAARLEGTLVVWILARRESGSRVMSQLLALAGAVLVVTPRPVIELSQRLVYANTDELRLRPWVKPAARALGALYLLVVWLSVQDTEPRLE